MNKYKFIQDVFRNKNLSLQQRDRFLMLINNEVSKDIDMIKSLDRRVSNLEKLNENTILTKLDPSELTLINEENNSKSVLNNSDLKQYISPESTARFLLNYNQNPILKSTCHEIDSNILNNIIDYCGGNEYLFEKHLQAILTEYNELEKQFAPPFIKAIIKGYLTGKDYTGSILKRGWSSENIQINWSSLELLAWSRNNPNIPPNLDEGLMDSLENVGFELNEIIKLKKANSNIYNFSQLSIFFKKLFHIRSDNSLLDLVLNINSSKRFENRIKFIIDENKFLKNVEFFTDVDKLLQGYENILELIIDVSSKSQLEIPIVELFLVETKEKLYFSILHHNSVYGKTIIGYKKRLGASYKNIINNQLNGICDFILEADFEDGHSYRLNIWNKKGLWTDIDPEEEELDDKVGGVKHILEIPYQK